MPLLAWIVLGLIASFISSKIVDNTGQGLVVDILLGVVGGFLFNQFGQPGVSGVNLYSLLVAVVGAVVVLWFYHALMGRRGVL